MTRTEVLNNLRSRFAGDILAITERSAKRVYIDIQPSALVKMATYVFKDLGARFNIASGIDARTHMEVIYHFTLEEINLLLSFRVKLLDKAKLELASLTSLIKGADWIERELHELLGIDFPGHPNLKRLLLPDDWPEGVYPLRRDYQEWDPQANRDRGV